MLNCGTTNKINGGPINLTTLIEIYQKTLKGVYSVCSFNLGDYESQIRSRDMPRDYFSSKIHFLS